MSTALRMSPSSAVLRALSASVRCPAFSRPFIASTQGAEIAKKIQFIFLLFSSYPSRCSSLRSLHLCGRQICVLTLLQIMQ